MILEKWLRLCHVSSLVTPWFPRIRDCKMLTPGQKVTLILKTKTYEKLSICFNLVLEPNYLMPPRVSSRIGEVYTNGNPIMLSEKKKIENEGPPT